MTEVIKEIILIEKDIAKAMENNDISQAFELAYLMQIRCNRLSIICEQIKTSINMLLSTSPKYQGK